MKQETINRIKRFVEERDWEQFHTPSNLAKSITIEAGELLECFQWDDQDFDVEHVKEELADIIVYCQNMLDELGLDVDEIVNQKMDQNEAKYPVEKAKGNATKYDQLDKNKKRKESNENILVQKGWEYFDKAQEEDLVFISDDSEANEILLDIENYPHAFVLACCMDSQIKWERAWTIPIKIMEVIGDKSIEALADVSLGKYEKIFKDNGLHRFHKTKAGVFYNAVHRIVEEYDGDASKIWANNPKSATVASKFLEFNGVGPKIASMATNILARDYHVPMSDYTGIDVSTDIHVRQVMERMGLVPEGCPNESIIIKAREISPDYPGIIDEPLFEIGKGFCHPQEPECKECPIRAHCDYFKKNK